jgi:hypothetical protein
MIKRFGLWATILIALLSLQCVLWFQSYLFFEAVWYDFVNPHGTSGITSIELESVCGALAIEGSPPRIREGACWIELGPIQISTCFQFDRQLLIPNLWHPRIEARPSLFRRGRPGWVIYVPYSLTTSATILLLIPGSRRRGRLRVRQARGQCLRCGYDLRASADRCPECGEPIAAGKK